MGSDSSLEQIKKLIRSWELSGLTKSAFCRDQQVSYHKFNYWQKRIGTPVRSAGDFVPVEVISSRSSSTDRITVRSKSGMEVSFPMNKESIAVIRQLLQ
jgi:hypothetical protein